MTPADIVLSHGWSALPHHPVLSVLDVALQAAVQVLRHAHPELDADGEPAPFGDDAPADLLLADVVVSSACALLEALRHYRTIQQNNIRF